MQRKRIHKYIAMVLTMSMLLSLLPVYSRTAQAAARAADLEVRVGNVGVIGNMSHDATNTFMNFMNSATPGFAHTDRSGTNIGWSSGPVDIYSGKDGWTTDTFVLDVSKNPALQAFAQSDHAEALVGFDRLVDHEDCILGFCKTRITDIRITHDPGTGEEVIISGRNLSARRSVFKIKPNSIIKISVTGEGDDLGATGVRGLYLQFEDKQRPVLNSYTFTGNGNERMNTKAIPNRKELYVKQQENITLAYNFSEPVRPTAVTSASSDYFLRHPLFTNVDGTGLPAAGQQMYLTNQSYTANNLTTLHKDIVYRYTGSRYHNSGNNALQPKLVGEASGVSQMDQTMEQKFAGAVLADGAGNVADIQFPNRASVASNSYLAGQTVDPFDFRNGGYYVIVDGVAPKYTKTGNGITPEIVTGVTLNKNDHIIFTIKFTEEAMIREGWEVEDTFIHLNNGMKAKYQSGENTDTWTFRMDITDELIQETPLLKVIALTNESKPGYTDKDVISDYAGNLLIQPANLLGEHTDGDTSLVNSTIDWAKLAIDNTKPIIGFRFEDGGATDQLYKKNGKVTIDANDPTILIPHLDPLTNIRGEERPSQGIYRPSNMTGSSSPAVGLVYYYWSQNPVDPFLEKAGDQWAAIKRYSLSAKQPSEDLYSTGFEDVRLNVANNKTNMIAPPSQAVTPENSGIWYLHSWTADMSWDSARELMQYEKKAEFLSSESGKAQYEVWKSELPNGSEADRIFYADNKALAAVGQYGDLSMWPLIDFKNEDSNWTYNMTPFRLDNKAPTIVFEEYSGDGTMDVHLTTGISDEHSGLNEMFYQWVAAGNAPAEIDWRPVTLTNGKFTASTLNEVFEDGQYQLHVRASDLAGNTVEQATSTVAVVNSASNVSAGFDPDSDEDYVPSHDVNFWINGIVPDKVAYAFSQSSVRPGSESAYTVLNAVTNDLVVGIESFDGEETSAGGLEESGNGQEQPVEEPAGELPVDEQLESGLNTIAAETFNYRIPAATDRNGLHYIHVLAKEGDRYFYYSKAYYFDNLPPTVTFSKSGVAYPLESHNVTVTVSEPYSVSGLTKQYQWVKEGQPVPDAASAGWLELPANGLVEIDNTSLEKGKIADFRLYVKAVDGAGNAIVSSTSDIFKVSKPGGSDTPPADLPSELIYLYGDEWDGYTAVLKLILDTADKRGYEFSISPDDGETWQKWRPYTNFAAVKVPTNVPSALQIKVKFRTPGGVIGDAKELKLSTLQTEEPIYAIATLGTTRPVKPDTGVEIQIAPPLGVRVTASQVNPTVPVRKGNNFTVRQNGYYSFDLVDLNDPLRKETLYVVVNNVDDVAPQGTIEYRVTEKTGGNVPVQLASTSEPVVILNNSGKSTFVFTENGQFTFQFRDEAGNIGTATATVNNIDKEAPQVQIVRSYSHGANNAETFGTITDDSGNVLLASGVKLTVEKVAGSTKEITVIGGNDNVILRENGTVSFTVADEYGNTSVVETMVDNLSSKAVVPEEITYSFVDDEGNPLPEENIVTVNGQRYAKGKVQVTLKGTTQSPNAVFAGVRPVSDDNGEYTNQISGQDGAFSYSRIFSSDGTTTVALSDLLGNVNRVPVKIAGLDNKSPELSLNMAATAIVLNKADFDFRRDLGGYTVSDNVSTAGNINVTITGLNLDQLGEKTVIYRATDEVGNWVEAKQQVVVVNDVGMLIFANGTLISGDSGQSALFDTNKLTFNISRYNVMDVGGQDMINEWGTYDLLYYSGLYREGQMKLIATKLTYKQLMDGNFEVIFPQTGWYTIIVRNQERERVFATFFVGNKQ
ncbi:Ig-like domain repeat protein [Paenibacillus agaridevorans]|nr:Ig-like domain repeat protein [Paenibacillus agaridevorans]